jgi:hypothetical protein
MFFVGSTRTLAFVFLRSCFSSFFFFFSFLIWVKILDVKQTAWNHKIRFYRYKITAVGCQQYWEIDVVGRSSLVPFTIIVDRITAISVRLFYSVAVPCWSSRRYARGGQSLEVKEVAAGNFARSDWLMVLAGSCLLFTVPARLFSRRVRSDMLMGEICKSKSSNRKICLSMLVCSSMDGLFFRLFYEILF